MIIMRFAPSPTGFLHIGSARTALFNWLYSQKVGGKFHLRIEDTDKARSTEEAVQAIISGLRWLGLSWDGGIVMQSTKLARHVQVAQELIALGRAYYCYLSPEEISDFRAKNPYGKIVSPWRDGAKQARYGILPVVRLKSEDSGNIVIMDKVQGEVMVACSELDDMVLLRSDDSPTYMLAVVADDHDAGVNFIIRGDDHLTNTFRQLQIYKALGWRQPQYAHIPLIHGNDGAKLSKRHGALGIEYYRNAGYLPEAMCNYLLRLGWGGDGQTEIFSMKEAAALFDIADVDKAPSRFDLQRLNSINAHYIAHADDDLLVNDVVERMNLATASDEVRDQKFDDAMALKQEAYRRMKAAMPMLKIRANTLVELVELAKIYIDRIEPMDEKAEDILRNTGKILQRSLGELVQHMVTTARTIEVWDGQNIKEAMSALAKSSGIKDGNMMQILRAMVIGTLRGPGIYETIAILGRDEFIRRISYTNFHY